MSARSFVLNKGRQGNITVVSDNGVTRIILHSTAVVTVSDKEIVLNSGGWRTNTTKTAINRALELLGIYGKVTQVKGVWYFNGKEFRDGMTIV